MEGRKTIEARPYGVWQLLGEILWLCGSLASISRTVVHYVTIAS